MTRVERTLRWVWLINGVVLLALLVAGGIFLLVGALAGLGGGGTASTPAARADSLQRAIFGDGVAERTRQDADAGERGRALACAEKAASCA